MSLFFDGERYVPEIGGVIHAEHLHRYRLARILAKGKDVLDVACGEGYGSDLLATSALSVAGVDISAKAVDNAQQTYLRENLRFVQGTCVQLPFGDASFDLVVSFETLEHHDQHELMISELRRVLRQSGTLLISTPNRPEYGSTLNEPNPYHMKELDFKEFNVLLRSNFKNVVFYAQRVLNGSCIAPTDSCAIFFRHFDFNGGGGFSIPRPVYFLAVAGNGPLPDLGASVYEVPPAEIESQESNFAEARLYISELVNGISQMYSESRGAAVVYPVSGRRQILRMNMPMDVKQLARIRLDPANRPLAIRVHGLALEKADGSELWRWDGDARMFRNIVGLAVRPEADCLLLLSLNDDPQFDLAIPSEVLAAFSANDCLVFELTPHPLSEVVSEVLSSYERLIADLHVELSKRDLFSRPSVVAFSDTLALRWSSKVEIIASLLKSILALREQTIAQQKKQLSRMREELLRAEAQLDLLKDLMLRGGEGDWL